MNFSWTASLLLAGMSVIASADVIPAGTEIAIWPDLPIEVARWDRDHA